jgi:hypothetical protein
MVTHGDASFGFSHERETRGRRTRRGGHRTSPVTPRPEPDGTLLWGFVLEVPGQ